MDEYIEEAIAELHRLEAEYTENPGSQPE